MIRWSLLLLVVYTSWAYSSPYDAVIDAAAQRHGVDRMLLRAIAAHESRKNPWTFNADGESFQFKSKERAVSVLWSLTKAPWLVKSVLHNGKVSRRFFATQGAAELYASYARTSGLRLRTDDSRKLSRGEIRVRKLRLINTDIGIAQVNYKWNGQGIATVQTWFDPAYNLDFAAARVAKLKKKHGNEILAAGYYHSATRTAREVYLGYLIPKYKEEKRLASVSLAAVR